ncbi:FAD/FMN-containing dehydrogenase [Nonomuraea solani]|uniref:FAD/FMN-containing dehydrogenase n=1 Tax=Nonomuraea solani TaxID=1144553 RepID=A0A1H6CJ56_9ACTN|nr:FAD-binding oxidoreductase [Nonomuraea solani]SEG72980.1 FAD/FMN-containing dehydrogenase [Nonomuraea solani]
MGTSRLELTGFAGQVLLPGDDGYDRHRSVWNAMVDRRPAVIARCASRDDVATAVLFGRAQGLEIGVLCGGHSILGLPIAHDGLLIDLTPMDAVRVDPAGRRAWVQGGALLGALDRATQPYGLATTAGNVSHTGVGGLTLGGGMGWLARAYGLSCDNVTSFEMVTADGDVVRADAKENPDLFWGLRGGGGNFGVVTEFEFRLHRVGTRCLLVDLYFPPEDAVAAMRGWRDLIGDAPRQATFTAWVGTMDDRPLASVGFVWVGDPDEGRRLLPALRGLGSPVAERVQELSYLDLQTMDDTVEGHRHRRYWKGHYFDEFPDEAIHTFLAPGAAFAPSASLQSYGGAIADVPDDETAFSHRGTLVEFVAAARWSDPAEDAERMAAARRYAASLEPFATGVYVNVLTDEGEGGVRRAYPKEKLDRLTALKDRYDPGNVFHFNQNIPPAAPRKP